jgi:alkylation response protein AidB-like acyl-CoA dehydrogenase
VWGIPAALIGMVVGMAEAFQSTLVGKRILFTGEKQVERVANQIKLAEIHTDIHAAQLLLRHRLQQVKQWGLAGAPPDATEALSSQRDAAYVARLMVKTATAISLAAGANSAYRSNPIQRFLRDIMVGANHTSLVWEEIAEYYGRAKWGLPPKLPWAAI